MTIICLAEWVRARWFAFAPRHGKQKADVVKHPEVFDHIGLLFDGPPSKAGLPLIQSSETHTVGAVISSDEAAPPMLLYGALLEESKLSCEIK